MRDLQKAADDSKIEKLKELKEFISQTIKERKEHFSKGLEQFREKYLKVFEKKEQAIKNLPTAGVNVEVIAKSLSLSIKEINELKKKIL